MGGIAVFIVAALVLGAVALAALLWAMRNRQFDDLKGAAERILIDDDEDAPPSR
jgi:cbb3-type cytochrome oxidase maturation protein